ncbi:DUF6049 family protein [uncultured Bifidobacterium sp.]|uniref:DUF6049 family protein n=1 Tax=uncultured Bifidobacterium sp. TaxID=165187 RepID=UPI0028DC2385|nr:DUF6049 family protein [uncultured Bifidobacterium sp.]
MAVLTEARQLIGRYQWRRGSVRLDTPEPRRTRRSCHHLQSLVAMLVVMLLSCLAPSAAWGAQTTTPEIDLSITESTPVVTSDSGYRIVVTVRNASGTEAPGGRLTVSTNSWYTFVSRSDIQHWAEGSTGIPTPDALGAVAVPAVSPHSSVSVTIDVQSDDAALTSITTWGPKPVLLEYSSTTGRDVRSHTFLTRSTQGLTTTATPAMNITVAVPLVSSGWKSDDEQTSALLASSESAKETAPHLTKAATQTMRQWAETLQSHPLLQAVADPSVIAAMSLPPQVTGVMQPGALDVTARAALGASAFAKAGISDASWTSSTALSQAATTLGEESSLASYAWQGAGRWTLQALTLARRQGYSTVIASGDFDGSDSSTVHTGTYRVSTDAGSVTVLAAQNVLTELAQGNPTDKTALAEHTTAGRLARFMAQSAFYQMEQPYVSRNVLVLLDTRTTPTEAGSLMKAIEDAPWLNLTTLSTLSSSKAYMSGSEAKSVLPSDSGMTRSHRNALTSALDTLADGFSDITRFSGTILDDGSSSSSASSSASSSSTSSEPESAASATWIRRIGTTYSRLALHALSISADDDLTSRMTASATGLSSRLLSSVSLTPSEGITVVSDTASMPVTVSNSNPYPVRVRVSSLTDSMEIVTSRFADVTVPARGEAQVTFTIRVATSAKATVHLTLLGRDGEVFSDSRSTTITSSLQLNDKSGLVIIFLAAVLGAIGLRRQLHRPKDPDE